MRPDAIDGYRPIADYAAIGDCHGVALISGEGSVDWCALGRFDADPTFCRLLDARKGGFLSVRPSTAFSATRRYLRGTNILRTEFRSANGLAAITDFMPVGRRADAGTYDYVSLVAPGWLIRRVEVLEGAIDLEIAYRPSVEFAGGPARLRPIAGGVGLHGGPSLYTDLELTIREGGADCTVSLRAGQRAYLVLAPDGADVTPAGLDRLFAVTRAFWEEWIGFCRYRGAHAEAVGRSALALKLLSFAPSGAIVAAPTTSLPERIGGSRNWDYRYCWIRDANLTLHALASLGYSGEARRFFDLLKAACRRPDVQLMYGIDGTRELPERCLGHLEGYRGSRPVRVGNDAFRQRQLDVYGYIFDAALVYRRLGGKLPADARELLLALADSVAQRWDEPDRGFWEVRDGPRQFVHSKLMCWVAIDRAIRLIGERPGWIALRRSIAETVLARGMDAEGAMLRAFDQAVADAALLLLPMTGFPADGRTLAATVERIGRDLRDGDLVRRYAGEDGAKGEEGAFAACSFWMVDALLAVGREAAARDLFERLVRRANDVGLYAEEIDRESGAFLGNFPQALTHLGLIGAAINLQLFAKGGAEAVRGSYADRAQRCIGAVFGWRGILSALLGPGHGLRFRSSRKSKLL